MTRGSLALRLALSPLALSPLALSPLALSPLALSPLTLSLLALSPLALAATLLAPPASGQSTSGPSTSGRPTNEPDKVKAAVRRVVHQAPTVAPIGDKDSRAEQQARFFQQVQVPGRQVRKEVRKLRDLHWYDNLESAARSARGKQKPIFYVQALGKLRGYT